MPFTKTIELAKAAPPVKVEYHLMAVPVATKFATVEPLQKVCATAVGAALGATVTVIVKVAPTQFPAAPEVGVTV